MEDKNAITKTDILGGNQIEDVRWLCSLSETELDMLIWIKMLILHRARKIGHESLAKEFSLKVLRSLSLTMMEHLTEQLKDLSVQPSYAEALKLLGESKLSRSHVYDDFSSMSSEELWEYICPEKRTRIAELFGDEAAPRRKQKI